MPLTVPIGIIEAPKGPEIVGRCRLSGEDGKFRNPADTPSVWTSRNPAARKKQANSFGGRIEMREVSNASLHHTSQLHGARY